MSKPQPPSIGGSRLDDALLEEVTALVEWPVVLTANFEEKFLAVPAEALVHTMKGDQKYFRSSEDGKLLPKFIFVTNIESKDPSKSSAATRKSFAPSLGRRVLLQDRPQTRLAANLPRLQTVLFQQQLGTVQPKLSASRPSPALSPSELAPT
ncbi:glycine--tRNA ligase subunit beta [Escherichia coli]